MGDRQASSRRADGPSWTIAPLTTADDLAEYDELLDRCPWATVFHRSWWLNAAQAADPLELLGYRDKKGVLTGALPLVRHRVLGADVCRNPPLSPYVGPVVAVDPGGRRPDMLSTARRVVHRILSNVPKCDVLSVVCPAGFIDPLPALWAGMQTSLSYTFRMTDHDSDRAAAEIAKKHKQTLKKAKKHGVTVRRSGDFDEFIALNRATFTRQGRSLPYADAALRRLFTVAHARDSAAVYVAYAPSGEPTDGLLVVQDGSASYLLAAGGDPQHRRLGGGALATWQAITDAHSEDRDFDFEGSSLPGVERYYRRWGGEVVPIMAFSRAYTWIGRAYLAYVAHKSQVAFPDDVWQ